MRLFGLAIVALRDDPDDDGSVEAGLHGGMLLHADRGTPSLDEQGDLARQAFPVSEGWRDHYATIWEIANPQPIESYEVTWQVREIHRSVKSA